MGRQANHKQGGTADRVRGPTDGHGGGAGKDAAARRRDGQGPPTATGGATTRRGGTQQQENAAVHGGGCGRGRGHAMAPAAAAAQTEHVAVRDAATMSRCVPCQPPHPARPSRPPARLRPRLRQSCPKPRPQCARPPAPPARAPRRRPLRARADVPAATRARERRARSGVRGKARGRRGGPPTAQIRPWGRRRARNHKRWPPPPPHRAVWQWRGARSNVPSACAWAALWRRCRGGGSPLLKFCCLATWEGLSRGRFREPSGPVPLAHPTRTGMGQQTGTAVSQVEEQHADTCPGALSPNRIDRGGGPPHRWAQSPQGDGSQSGGATLEIWKRPKVGARWRSRCQICLPGFKFIIIDRQELHLSKAVWPTLPRLPPPWRPRRHQLRASAI